MPSEVAVETVDTTDTTDTASSGLAATRWPGFMVLDRTARSTVRSAALWGCVFGLYVASSALGYASAYKTVAQRTALAKTFGSNPGMNAIIGPAHQIQTVAGFTAWRSLGVLSIVGAVWGLLTATRLLRGEEEAGRWELLLAGQTTRRSAAAQAVVGLGAGLLTLWIIPAIVAALVGQSSKVRIGTAPALYLALALVSSAAVFLAVGALASQLAPTRRQAASYSATILGVAYALRMAADSGTGLEWLRWATPLGWVEELRPLTSPRPLLLLPIGGLVVALAAIAVHLAGARDLDASTIPDRTSAVPHLRLLAGPTGLTIRLTRGVIIGWAVAIALLGLMMGLIAKSIGGVLSSDAGDRDTFARMGFRGSGAEQYLGITFLIVALLVGLIAAGQLSAAHSEEADGRLDHLLVRPLSRSRWLTGRLGVAFGCVLGAGLIAGISSWLGAASQNSGVGLPTLLEAGLNVVPPSVFLLGVGVLTLGVWPRAISAVTYGLLAWSFMVEIIGGLVNAPHLVLDTSLFHQMAAAPAISPNWTSGGVLILLGFIAAGAGGIAFSRRNLVGQ
jgi:ABC-2 type transport system permease protein